VTDIKDNPNSGGDPSPNEKLAEIEKVVASYEKDKATFFPLEQVQELVASKADEIATAKIIAYKEEQRRASAMESLTATRKDLNLETKDEDYRHLTASDIEKLADDLGSIKLGATAESIKYTSFIATSTVDS
jgi:hypothetical protein